MNTGKSIARTAYSAVFLIVGAIVAVAGAIWWQFPHEQVYDLPILMLAIGIGVAGYGLLQLLQRKTRGQPIYVNKKTAMRFLANNAIIIALLLMVVVICFMTPRFLKGQVVLDILAQSSTRLVVALGICFALMIAGTDLSAGRMIGLSGVIATSMLQNQDYSRLFFPNLGYINIFIPIILALLACMVFGALNGFLVAQFGMHPFIGTLAVSMIVYGVCCLYFDLPPNNSQPIGGVRDDFKALGQTKLLQIGDFPGISILVLYALIICVIIWFVLNKTVFGKNVYAVGGNREAAVVSGVNVYVTILFVFIVGSLMYGIGGLMESARTAGATNAYGQGYETDAIASCVVGGVSMAGGVGKVSGIVTGVLIFTVIQYGLQFIGMSPHWQQVIKGIIIAVAVAIDLAKYKKR